MARRFPSAATAAISVARAPLLAALSLAALLLAGGCTQSDALLDATSGRGRDGGGDGGGGGGASMIGRPCAAHVDCQQQAACLEGICRRECAVDTDCAGPTWMCWGYRCLPKEGGADTVAPPGSECASWNDCDQSTPHGCRNGYCVAPECYTRGEDPACATLGAARPYCFLYTCQAENPDAPDTVAPPRDVVGPTDAGPERCAVWSDCVQQDGPQGCRDGRCVPAECESNGDCRAASATASCRFYLCVEPDPPPRDVVDPPSDVPPPDVGEPPPDVPPPPLGAYGDPCTGGADCATNLCLDNKTTGGRTCTKECGTSFDCPAPDWCGGTAATFPLGLPLDVCIPSDAGLRCADIGGLCTSGRSFGAGASCVCTQPCPNATYCPDEYGCVTDASAARLCRPIGRRCAPSADGTPDPECLGSICYPLDPQGTIGVCTVPCESSNDCPGGWFCYSENVEGTIVKTCQRVQ